MDDQTAARFFAVPVRKILDSFGWTGPTGDALHDQVEEGLFMYDYLPVRVAWRSLAMGQGTRVLDHLLELEAQAEQDATDDENDRLEALAEAKDRFDGWA